MSIDEEERLLCILTAPSLRITLLSAFFASPERVKLLRHAPLRAMFEGALFEPWHAPCERLDCAAVGVVLEENIPAPAHPASRYDPLVEPSAGLLSTREGLLLHELQYASREFMAQFGALLAHGAALSTRGCIEQDIAVQPIHHPCITHVEGLHRAGHRGALIIAPTILTYDTSLPLMITISSPLGLTMLGLPHLPRCGWIWYSSWCGWAHASIATSSTYSGARPPWAPMAAWAAPWRSPCWP